MHLISARLDSEDLFVNRTDTIPSPSDLTFKERRQKINKKKKALLVWMWGETGRADSRWSEQLRIWCHLLREGESVPSLSSALRGY